MNVKERREKDSNKQRDLVEEKGREGKERKRRTMATRSPDRRTKKRRKPMSINQIVHTANSLVSWRKVRTRNHYFRFTYVFRCVSRLSILYFMGLFRIVLSIHTGDQCLG